MFGDTRRQKFEWGRGLLASPPPRLEPPVAASNVYTDLGYVMMQLYSCANGIASFSLRRVWRDGTSRGDARRTTPSATRSTERRTNTYQQLLCTQTATNGRHEALGASPHSRHQAWSSRQFVWLVYRFIFRIRRNEHITDAIVSLHWLRVQERILFRISVLTTEQWTAVHNRILVDILHLRPRLWKKMKYITKLG